MYLTTLPPIAPFYVTSPSITKDNWRSRADEKRAERDALIPAAWRLPAAIVEDETVLDVTGVPKTCGILSEREIEITELDDLEELARRIAARECTALEVTMAYCKRAAIAQQLVNCLHGIYFDKALARAKELDEQLEKTGKTAGPLHGIPISLKDQFDVEGEELNMGYASYIGRISTRNSSLVQMLLDSGAVIYCRTSCPQTMMISDTFNFVYGRTRNPRNRHLTAGGSSGGEGALLAMKGSILGVGTDIGGSIRIPSSFNGLYGLRPTTRRVPYGYATNSMLGQKSVMSVAGPLARSVPSISYFMKCILDVNASNYDACSLPFPYNSSAHEAAISTKKLVFGLMRHDHCVAPVPPVQRALEVTAERLRAAGHEVIEFDGEAYKDARGLLDAFFRADGGEDLRSVREAIAEPLIPLLTFDDPSNIKTTYEVWQMNREKERYQQDFLAQWLATAATTSTGKPIDALLLPVTSTPAYVPVTTSFWAGYTGLINVLDLPAMTIQVTRVDPKVDGPRPDHVPMSAKEEEVHRIFSPEITAGMPVAIQLVGRRWQEEELLGIAERLVEVIGKIE